MNNQELRKLAGLDILTEKKWSGDVKVKVEVPEGLFDGKSAKKIAVTLVKLHDGDRGKAMQALTFYMNRAGKNLSDERRVVLDKAKERLSTAIKTEEINTMRRFAGLPLLEKKKEDDEEVELNVDADDGDHDDDELPAIVLSVAKRAVGKDVDALSVLLLQVYQAGYKDGNKDGLEDATIDAVEDGDVKKGKTAEDGEVK